MKKLCILGVTGSIGTQSIEVVLGHPELFTITAISCGRNIQKCEKIMNQLQIPHICVQEEKDYKYLKEKYPDKSFYLGSEGMIKLASLNEVDIVLNAVVGFAGLLPTIEAIKAGKDIAIANKETLVAAGHIIIPLVKEYQVKILPVDSEHSAIWQSLYGRSHNEIDKIILTCSGGSFRDKSKEELRNVTVEQALKHPNWNMGAKITVDSATLFNKGLEVIEAKWLFDVDYDQIEVLIHPESVIHSMVEFKDHAIIGQLGTPDMKLPIQYALTYPRRDNLIGSERLDLTKTNGLHFYHPDTDRFPALTLAYEAGRRGGSMPCVLNAANEQANSYFREGKIRFLDIYDLVRQAMYAHQAIDQPTLDELLEIDKSTRLFVQKKVRLMNADYY